MHLKDILIELRQIKNATSLTYSEYWMQVNKSEKIEQKKFDSEKKKLRMTVEDLNRCFTI